MPSAAAGETEDRNQSAAGGSRGGDLEEMTRQECLDLLATEEIGRLSVVVGHYPEIFCVNYRLDGDIVVLRTRLGGLLATSEHANIGFEVDHLDPASRSGRSVLICGMTEDVTDRVPSDAILQRSRNLAIDPWPAGERPRILRIIPASMTGRKLHPGEMSWSKEDNGYL